MFWSNEKTRHICGLYCKYTEKICLIFFSRNGIIHFKKIKPRFACHVKTKQKVLSKPGMLASVCPAELCWAEAQTKHHHPDYKDWANSKSVSPSPRSGLVPAPLLQLCCCICWFRAAPGRASVCVWTDHLEGRLCPLQHTLLPGLGMKSRFGTALDVF